MGKLDREKLQDLLAQLQSQHKDIEAEILLSPNGRTRPGIGLVASYDRVFQSMFLAVPMGVIFATCIALMALGVSALDSLDWLNSIKGPIAALFTATGVPWSISRMGVGLILFFLVTFLMGKFTLGIGPLDLDLNGIFHNAPQGRCYTPWTKVVTGRTVRKRRIKLILENGGHLTFGVPRADRDCLAEVVDRLIMSNQTDDLKGKLPGLAPQTDVSQPQRGGREGTNALT